MTLYIKYFHIRHSEVTEFVQIVCLYAYPVIFSFYCHTLYTGVVVFDVVIVAHIVDKVF